MAAKTEPLVFLDTNVLIYALDARSGPKHERARSLVEELWRDRRGALSVQVFSEAAVNLRKKAGCTWGETRAVLAPYLLWRVVSQEPGDVLLALEIAERHEISLWDAWIVRAAVKAGATVLATEDLSHGQVIEGVRVEDPFARS